MTETSNVVPFTIQPDDEAPPEIERIPAKAIIAACEHLTRVNFAEMRSHGRTRRVSIARKLTWAAIHRLRPDFTRTRIGQWFDRDHSTVVASLQRWRGTQAEIEEVAVVARRLVRRAQQREERMHKDMRRHG